MEKIILQTTKTILTFIVIQVFVSCSSESSNPNSCTEDTMNSGQPIMVFAGAGLTNVLIEIVDSFEAKYELEVKTNLASSGTLARQIEQGVTPDIYISASKRWADYIDSLGYVKQGLKKAVAQNDLVLVSPKNSTLEVAVIDSSTNFLSFLHSGRLSIGDPSHVPAGKYARQSLEYYGWYNKLEDKKLPAKDVRSALMVVEMEEVPLGIVYLTDALKSKKVKILNTFPEKSHKPIIFVAEVCKDNQGARLFFNFLNSDNTKAIWLKHGFRK